MNEPEMHIQSYFSIETDLAKEFSNWPEFIEGNEYDVLLRNESGEEVSTKLFGKTENDDKFVQVKSNSNGVLFQRALGYATYLLAQHSDNLMVHKWS